MAEPRYRIGAVARLSGLSTHVIRVWERRYGVLKPNRSGGGARLYSAEEVERLRLLKRAVDRGHAIGQLADLDQAELERLGGASLAPSPAAELVDEFYEAVLHFDAHRARQLLDRAALLFSARSLVLEVLSPLLVRIGSAWAAGRLCVASEHIASTLVRDRAGSILRGLSRAGESEMVLVTTPAGELHELGAILAAATAAMQGCAVLYLGPNLPASEIALAARESAATVVALSVVALEQSVAAKEIRSLLENLPKRVDIVLGGPFADSLAEVLGARVAAPGGLADFERWLAARRGKTAPLRS